MHRAGHSDPQGWISFNLQGKTYSTTPHTPHQPRHTQVIGWAVVPNCIPWVWGLCQAVEEGAHLACHPTSSLYFTLVLYTHTHTYTCAHTTYAYMCIHVTCLHAYVYVHMHTHTQYLACKMFKAKILQLNSVWQLLPWNITWKTCSLLFGGSGSRPALPQLFVVIWLTPCYANTGSQLRLLPVTGWPFRVIRSGLFPLEIWVRIALGPTVLPSANKWDLFHSQMKGGLQPISHVTPTGAGWWQVPTLCGVWGKEEAGRCFSVEEHFRTRSTLM